jgi:hypothetical protein
MQIRRRQMKNRRAGRAPGGRAPADAIACSVTSPTRPAFVEQGPASKPHRKINAQCPVSAVKPVQDTELWNQVAVYLPKPDYLIGQYQNLSAGIIPKPGLGGDSNRLPKRPPALRLNKKAPFRPPRGQFPRWFWRADASR